MGRGSEGEGRGGGEGGRGGGRGCALEQVLFVGVICHLLCAMASLHHCWQCLLSFPCEMAEWEWHACGMCREAILGTPDHT